MCGILFELSSSDIDKKKFNDSLNLLNHRGPDAQNIEYRKSEFHRLAFGHTRLKIIDVDDSANQPYVSECGNFILIFNGEIYNYKELRESLREKNYIFNTESDTEVLLQAIICYGYEVIEKLNGMWSFLCYNKITKEVCFSRDNYGKKPLLYYADNNRIIFASEMKAILSLVDSRPEFRMDHFHRFLSGGVINVTEKHESIYKGIYNVIPGSIGCISIKNQTMKISHRKNKNDFFRVQEKKHPVQNLREDLMSSVSYRLQSDREVGIFISGGVDSSVVAACASLLQKKDIMYFTGDTGGGYNNNDLKYSLMLAKSIGVDCVTFDCSPENHDIFQINEEMTRQYDMPVSFMGNAIACYLMYKQASDMGIRVVLDGTGGDEIFGGYYNLFFEKLVQELLNKRKFLTLYRVIKYCAKEMPVKFIYETVKKNAHIAFVGKKDFDFLTDYQKYAAQYSILPNWLFQNDNNAMHFSIENRSPLLDVNLAKYINMDVSKKFNGAFNKYFPRKAIPDIVPDEVRWRTQKQGFRFVPNNSFIQHKSHVMSIIKKSDLLKELYQSNNVLEKVGDVPTNAYSIAKFEEMTM